MSDTAAPFADLLSRAASELALARPLFPTYTHLIVSALFPIFAGAHASLSRPSSAAQPQKKTKTSKSQDDDEDSDEEEEELQRMEGLSPSDAVMFPVLAGCTLAGLYFLIKWLQDPSLLNNILNWYFALFGVFSVSKLIRDGLDFAHGLVFPKRYISDGALWQVKGSERRAKTNDASDTKYLRTTPLPGVLSKIPLPASLLVFLWSIREIPRQKWIVKLYIHRITALKAQLGINSAVGALTGLLAVIYFNTVDKPWFLTNLMGFGFSYGALQIMSPTTFATGSLILSALFFYDIYFVFFTPMMVTVAKSLDIPIKLVFPRPPTSSDDSAIPSYAMLGLGDVVLPGIMIGLALRFDLYLFYLKKQRKVRGESGAVVVTKAKYVSVSNRWGENFWTKSWLGGSSHSANEVVRPLTFPKPYFYASLTGYVVGMTATLVVMHVFEHAQPALLYLVPGVLSFTWLTALLRGELDEMWNFSEAVEDETPEPKDGSKTNDTKQDGPSSSTSRSTKSFFSNDKSERTADLLGSKFMGSIQQDTERTDQKPETREHGDLAKNAEWKKTKKGLQALGRKMKREIFSLSIEAPFDLPRQQSAAKGSSAEDTQSKKET